MDEPPILLYDNDCGVCHWAVRFVLKNDSRRRFMFAALDSPTGLALRHQYGISPSVDSIVLVASSRALIRSDAVIEIVRLLSWPWRILAVAAVLPQRMRDAGYDAFAGRREAISRRFGLACAVPTIEERARFLDRDVTGRSIDVT
jgi:predicted DCC family thiol-disulfide oxidoreductase YuxK